MAEADPHPLEALYDRYAPALYGLALRVLQDPGEAETVVQAVFSDAWSRMRQAADADEPPAWWFAAAGRRRTIEQLRARFAPAPDDLAVVDLPMPALDRERAPLSAETVSRLRSALAALPFVERTAIELAALEGLTPARIAERLEHPPGTVRARLRAGLRTLREALAGMSEPGRVYAPAADLAGDVDGMSEPTHESFDGQAALYALGVLVESERERFELHLETSVDSVREVKSLLPVTRQLPLTPAPLDPPPALRERVLREAGGLTPAAPDLPPAPVEPDPPPVPARGPSRLGFLFWFTAVLLVAAASAGGWYVADLHRRMADLQAEADSATTQAQILRLEATVAELEATRREEVIAIATDPTVRSLTMTGQPLAPEAAGRALWTEAGRLAFLADGLPALPEGGAYQLWFVMPAALDEPDDGPEGARFNPVGSVQIAPEADGGAAVTLDVPETVTMPTAMAVTVEPAGGAAVPSGDLYLLGRP